MGGTQCKLKCKKETAADRPTSSTEATAADEDRTNSAGAPDDIPEMNVSGYNYPDSYRMDDVSVFIIGTLQIHPVVTGFGYDSWQFDINSSDECELNTIQCGSSVEFYIKPINACIDDIDIMKSSATNLFCTGHIPVLPDDYRGLFDTMSCVQITQYPDYPGFVQLREIGEIKYNWHYKQFEFQYNLKNDAIEATSRKKYDGNQMYKMVGPSLRRVGDGYESLDMVVSFWCPQWPDVAKDWRFRRRIYGWPTTTNIRDVVHNGCHIVYVTHPACRNDLRQWRLSFSVAEVILLRSWTPVQQVVYHMLRFFAKRELIKKDCPKEDEVLCTYHLKTLMLWSCEEMSPEWWYSLTLTEICCYLLRKLSEWLTKRCCRNFFIPQANLFHERMNQEIINETVGRLNEFCHVHCLIDWFSVNYVKPALEKVNTLVGTVESMTLDPIQCVLLIYKILDAWKLKLFVWQLTFGFNDCVKRNYTKKNYNFGEVINFFFGTRCSSLPSTVVFSQRFPQFAKVLFSLNAAVALGFQQFTYDSNIFTRFIKQVSLQPKVVRSKHHNFPKPSKTSLDRSFVLFLKAQELMENLTGLNSPEESKLVFQLSKELLRNSTYCDDFDSRAFRNAALVYMAAIYFSESDYETATEFCSAVFINKKPAAENYDDKEVEDKDNRKETLNAGCLLYFDDIIRIIGFYLLFRHRRVKSHYNRRLCLLDLRLTPEVFAQYLILSSNEGTYGPFRLNYILQTPTFQLDEILVTITNRKLKSSAVSKRSSVLRVYQGTDPINKLEAFTEHSLPNEDNIIHLLIEYSLENMMSFCKALCQDFGIQSNVAECYRAAYLYRCHRYSEVLHLCERILEEPDLQSHLKDIAFANVMVLPPLDSYFDNDIQSLLGFRTLCCHLSPMYESLLKMKMKIDSKHDESTFWQYCARELHSDKSFFDKFIMCWHPLQLHYFVGGRFLAKYLKVRCLINCNRPHSEIMLEIMAMKSRLPLEQIIRWFVEQKLTLTASAWY